LAQRTRFLELLQENDIDVDWLLSKKTAELDKLAQITFEKYYKKA